MNTESFRDKIATADQKGRRIWIYPTKPKGKLHRARLLVAMFLLVFFFVAPFLKIHGKPIILFNFIERQFVFFGLIFNPQDFYLFVLAILIMIIFIVFFTAIFGRLFCGWICPQTIFMEMVFRKIEYFIDGRPSLQKKLANASWDFEKILRRLLKHSIFISIALIVNIYVVAYIIGVEKTAEFIIKSPTSNPIAFIAILVFSFMFYGNYAWFREQTCTIVCPYGRLQSVLIDSNSIIVAYDYTRGEPRGKIVKGVDQSQKGDCIDCFACVKVCPTGIDIRNGTQLECVNCTACIDSCNKIMQKVKRPTGLIRYTSENRLAGKQKVKLPGRIIVYLIALTFLLSLSIGLLASRSEVESIILRASGSSFYEIDNNSIRNLYTVKLTNKTFEQIPLLFRLKTPSGGKLIMVAGNISLEPEETTETAFFIEVPKNQLYASTIMVVVEVLSADKVINQVTTTFMGPRKTNK